MIGKFEKGLRSVEQGLTCSGEEHWWDAELYRLWGELKLSQPQQDPTGAKECFKQALHIAESQKAMSLKQRATASLARIREGQDANEDPPR
jgi:predicted ATPase